MSENKNRNGYEIREGLLGMAQGILGDKCNRAFENEMIKPEDQRNAVPSYTTEEIITEAEKLYAFVQKKD